MLGNYVKVVFKITNALHILKWKEEKNENEYIWMNMKGDAHRTWSYFHYLCGSGTT